MKYFTISLLLCFAVEISADNTLRFTTSSSVGAFPEVVDMFSTMYSRLGYQIEIIKLPDRRSMYEAGNRDWIDGELARVKEAELLLPDHIRIPVPVSNVAVSAFVKTLNFESNGWRSLKPYKLGSLRGIIATEKNLVGFNTLEAGSPSQLLEMLDRGRIQIAIMPRPMGEFALMTLPYNIRILAPPIDTFTLYHYVNKKHQAMVPQITQIMSELTGAMIEME